MRFRIRASAKASATAPQARVAAPSLSGWAKSAISGPAAAAAPTTSRLGSQGAVKKMQTTAAAVAIISRGSRIGPAWWAKAAIWATQPAQMRPVRMCTRARRPRSAAASVFSQLTAA